MNTDATSSARVLEVDYETNRAVIRFEGTPPEVSQDVLLHPEQCGWIDEFGNVYPMGAWKPAKRTWLDADKTAWKPVYRTGNAAVRAGWNSQYCHLCGGSGGHWEGCKAPNAPAASCIA